MIDDDNQAMFSEYMHASLDISRHGWVVFFEWEHLAIQISQLDYYYAHSDLRK